MRIAIAQVRGQIDDPPANASKAKMLINNTDVDLLIFPEMFATGYDRNCGRFLDNMDAMFMNKLNTQISKKKNSVLFGCPVSDGKKIYNCALLSDGENLQVYRKIHLDSDMRFPERDTFTAGDEPTVFNCNGFRFGIVIGNDIMFNELFRWYAMNDVDAVICISAAPGDVLDRYEKILPSRCVENSLEIIFVNMVGPDPGITMAGGSRYVSFYGEVEANCTDSSDVRIIKLDTERMKRSKENRRFLKEIRTDIKWA
ncbi:MAG: carbon-nitrogen hydrolase family protein [Methanomassiliicoccaceae archaeon]|nr:carbon-nitrogen hydrolase family protein [Methanomassiliicoccaceae archaeon]